jgi:hypothetical protein
MADAIRAAILVVTSCHEVQGVVIRAESFAGVEPGRARDQVATMPRSICLNRGLECHLPIWVARVDRADSSRWSMRWNGRDEDAMSPGR